MIRRILLVAACSFGIAGAAVAQNPPPAGGPGQGGPGGGPGAFAQRRVSMLLQGITLTDVQRARVDSIVAAFVTQMPPMQMGTPPDSATRARRRELIVRQDSTIRAMLTPEQQQAWDRNVQNMPSGRRPGM